MNEKRLGRHYTALLFVCLCLILVFLELCFTHGSDASFQEEATHESRENVEEKYLKKWNVSILPCKEVSFYESVHPAFGDGFRYSVLSGNAVLSTAQQNGYGEKITVIAGVGADPNVMCFLSDVWAALKVPRDQRCSMRNSNWKTLSLEDGSRILVVNIPDSKLCYIAEQLS